MELTPMAHKKNGEHGKRFYSEIVLTAQPFCNLAWTLSQGLRQLCLFKPRLSIKSAMRSDKAISTSASA